MEIRIEDDEFFSWLRTQIFLKNLVHTNICQEIVETDAKIKAL